MKQEDDLAYFQRRAREEREKAENAVDPAGYRIHTEFAREYERRIMTAIPDKKPKAGVGQILQGATG